MIAKYEHMSIMNGDSWIEEFDGELEWQQEN
jgi:hypothetical protein